MINELHKEKAPLPYGMIITHIYRHFDLNLSHEVGRKVSDENIIDAYWTLTLSYQGSKVSKSKSPKTSTKKRKHMYDTSSKGNLDIPTTKSKGVKIKEPARVIRKIFKYSNDSKGKKNQQFSKKDEAKLLRKFIKETQKTKKKEPTRRSSKMKSSALASATSIKSNLP